MGTRLPVSLWTGQRVIVVGQAQHGGAGRARPTGGAPTGTSGTPWRWALLRRRMVMCFAAKVCRFARKVGRFASQRQKRHRERLRGALHRPLTKGPQNTMSTPSCVLSSPKTVTLPKGLPRLSERLAVRSTGQRFFTPAHGRRVSPFSRQRFVAKCATHGNAFRQRPRAMLVMGNAVDRPGTLCSPSIAGG